MITCRLVHIVRATHMSAWKCLSAQRVVAMVVVAVEGGGRHEPRS
jgi:hypothetical protein